MKTIIWIDGDTEMTPIEVDVDGYISKQHLPSGLDIIHDWGALFMMNIFPLNRYKPYISSLDHFQSSSESFKKNAAILILPPWPWLNDDIYMAISKLNKAAPNAKVLLGPFDMPPYNIAPMENISWKRNLGPRRQSMTEMCSPVNIAGAISTGLYSDASVYEPTFGFPVFCGPPAVTSRYIENFVKDHDSKVNEGVSIEFVPKGIEDSIFLSKKSNYFIIGSLDYKKLAKVYPIKLLCCNIPEGSTSEKLYLQYQSDNVDIVYHLPPVAFRESLKASKVNIHVTYQVVWGKAVIEAHVLGRPTVSSSSMWGDIIYPDLSFAPYFKGTEKAIERIKLLEENRDYITTQGEKNLYKYLAPQARKKAIPFVQRVMNG